MSNDVIDAETLAQFLRECEPPTPPPSASLIQLPGKCHEEFSSSSSHRSMWPFDDSFVLEEVDQSILLQVVDKHITSAKLSSNGLSSETSVELLKGDRTMEHSSETVWKRKLEIRRLKQAMRRNRHREKVKNEWRTLQLQRAELSARLAVLHATSQMKWQAIALKELAIRRQAEAQQHNIRTAIECHAAAIETFQRIINLEENSRTPETHGEHEWKTDDIKLYKNFMKEIRDAYERTDEVLNTSGVAGTLPTGTSFTEPSKRKDELRNLDYFETTSSFVLPYQYSKTAKAMFDSTRQLHHQNPNRILLKAVDDNSNTIAVKFGLVYRHKSGKSIPLGLTVVIHRFVELGRTVVVWRSLIYGGADFTGAFLHSVNWCVIRPTSIGGVDGTDVRICMHVVPAHQNEDGLSDGEAFTNVVLRTVNQDKLEITRLVHKLLHE